MDYTQRIGAAFDLLRDTDNAVAFTGAGISTESGISDFRSPGGVWDRYKVVTYQEFQSSEDKRKGYWKMKSELFKEMDKAKPNRAHMALTSFEKMGKLRALITQNIDGLHQEAGNHPDNVIELHGTNRTAYCLSCQSKWPISEIQARLQSEDFDPRCTKCNGLIKPSTISFGQSMPVTAIERAVSDSRKSQVFLMIGSSLQVEPAASIPPSAHEAGAELIFINRTPTQWDHLASIIFHEDAGQVLGELDTALKQ